MILQEELLLQDFMERKEAEFSEHLLTLCQACQGSSQVFLSRFCPVLFAGPASEVRSQLILPASPAQPKHAIKEIF